MTDPLLLYDGTCGFCDRVVRFVLRHDRRRTLYFATLQGPFGTEIRNQYPAIADVDSVVWAESGKAYVRSEAAIHLGRYLGGLWGALAVLGQWIPRSVRDGMYDWFARRRYRWFGRVERCDVLDLSERDRFLD